MMGHYASEMDGSPGPNHKTGHPPKYDPLRRYIAVYRIKGELSLSAIAFTNQIAAWTKPQGPNVPEDLQIVNVIDVKYPA